MAVDLNGLEVSRAAPCDVAALDDFNTRLLRLDDGLEKILGAAARPEAAPMILMQAAGFYLYGQTRAADAEARRYMDGVVPHLGELTPREHAWFHALDAWHGRHFHRALGIFEEILEEWPQDLPTAKPAEFLYYVLGQQHQGHRFRNTLAGLEPHHATHPDFLGMQAFASELCGDYATAEAQARRSLELEPRNPWGHHALTHVLIKQGRDAEGRALMESALPVLKTCGRLIYGHDAWHLGLLCLEQRDFAAARQVYREHVWGFLPDLVGEQIDAIALLWRMEMAGEDCSAHWPEIVRHVLPLVHDCAMPFASAHHAYALARAGEKEGLHTLLKVVHERTHKEDEEARLVWQPMGLRLVEGCAAFGRGDVMEAMQSLEPILGRITEGGGSDAQVDLFRQTYLVSLIRAGETGRARHWFETLMQGKQPTELDRWFAGQVQAE